VKDLDKDRIQNGRPNLLSGVIEDLTISSQVYRTKVLLIGVYIASCGIRAKLKAKGEEPLLYTSLDTMKNFLSFEVLYNPMQMLTYQWGKQDIFQDSSPAVIWRVLLSMAPLNLDLPSHLTDTVEYFASKDDQRPSNSNKTFLPGEDLATALSVAKAFAQSDRSSTFKAAHLQVAQKKQKPIPNPPTDNNSVIVEDRKSALVWHERLFRGKLPPSFAIDLQTPPINVRCAMTGEEIMMKSTKKHLFNIYGSDSELIIEDEVITDVNVPHLTISIMRSATPQHRIALKAGGMTVQTQSSCVAFEMLASALKAHFHPLFHV